jgi:hypothetical protein
MCDDLNATIINTDWNRQGGFDGAEWVSNSTLRDGLPGIEETLYYSGLQRAGHFLECHPVGRCLVAVIGLCVGAATVKFVIYFVAHLPIPSNYRDSLVWLLDLPFQLLAGFFRVVRQFVSRVCPQLFGEGRTQHQESFLLRDRQSVPGFQPVAPPPSFRSPNPASPDSGYGGPNNPLVLTPRSGPTSPQVKCTYSPKTFFFKNFIPFTLLYYIRHIG